MKNMKQAKQETRTSQRHKSGRMAAVALALVVAGGIAPSNYSNPFVQQAHAQSGGINVLLNGRVLNLGAAGASQVNGRVLVPLRGVFEALGASVDYDAATMTVFATRADTQIQLRIGSTQANVNGQTRFLDVPAQTRFGRTLVPLRFVSEALGANVSWSDAQRTVYISANDPIVVPPVGPPVTPPVMPPVVQRETLTGVVVGAIVSTNTFVLRTDDNQEITVRTDVALPRALSTYDEVRVTGVVNGTEFVSDTLTIQRDVRPLRGAAEVTAVNRNRITVRFDDGRTFDVVPTDGTGRFRVGDTVRVNGYLDENTIRYAEVKVRNTPDNTNTETPPPVAGVAVDFSGTVETVAPARDTLTVRGDNGQLYTITYPRVREVARNQRVRVQGTYADGVTTARIVTRLDN